VSSEISSTAQPETIQRFWGKYLALLRRYGIDPRAERWYVRRAELYIESVQGRRLTEHRPADVSGYLAELGRLGRLEDWQFRQAVDAIQKLLELVGVSWLQEVDWQYWLESARSLPADHPTIARSPSLRQGATAVVGQVSPARPGDSGGAALVLERLVAVIRQRNYSIRTEEAYRSWTIRFLASIGDRDPRDAGAAEVANFLETLALQGNVAASTQNQALNALVFLYGQVLEQPLGEMGTFRRAVAAQTVTGGADARGGGAVVGASGWDLSPDGVAVVWHGDAPDGVSAAAGKGCGFRVSANPVARREGAEGSGGAFTRPADRSPAGASGAGQGAARGGCAGGLWRGLSDVCTGQEISERAQGVGLAKPVPQRQAVGGPTRWDDPASPSA